MEIQYVKRQLLSRGLGEKQGPFSAHLGYFLFAEAHEFFGVLPPYQVLNKTLEKGRLWSSDNTIFEWQPFRLSRTEYDDLKVAIEMNPGWGAEVHEEFQGSRKYFERWALLRTIEKTPTYG